VDGRERARVIDRYLTRARAFERVARRREGEWAGLYGAPRPRTRTGHLTRREIEVLTLVSSGLSNATIAARLVVSEQTVKAHLASILGKLGAHNRAHAVAIALLYDLVPRDGLVRALSLSRVDVQNAA
jgi:DNA-binding NarL/FixJ family response regulator